MPSFPTVSIIIVNHNTPSLVGDCVDSLRSRLVVDHEIIIVESGTERPVLESLIRSLGAKHVPTVARRGFGQANNLGAMHARGRFLWLLNSDTIVPDTRANALFSLLDRYPEVGMLSPVLFRDHALTQRQSDFYANFQSFRTLMTRRLQPEIDWEHDPIPEIIHCEQVTAAAMVIRSELFCRLRGFDERYFMYMEDDDLCYRARQLGAFAAIATIAPVVHLQGQSIAVGRERKRLYYASQRLFWEKHHGWMHTLVMRFLRLPMRALKG